MTYAVAWMSKTGEKRAYHDTEDAATAHEAQLRREAVVCVVAYWCGEVASA